MLIPGQSYAGAASHFGNNPNDTPDLFDEQLPDRNAAIVCEAAEGFTLDDHLRALLPLVGARDILHASKISHQRVCVYLKEPWMADKVACSLPLIYKDKHISYRKYVSGALRVFLSNVQPDIPARALNNVLSRFGRVVGRIKRLKAACHDPEFAHVQGFRRIANLVVDNIENLPLSVPLAHLGTTYNIFLNLEDITCSTCHNQGHHFSKCRESAGPAQAYVAEGGDPQTVQEPQLEHTSPRIPCTGDAVDDLLHAEAEDMELGPSTSTLKRTRDSPPRETAKKLSRRETGSIVASDDALDDSELSSIGSDTENGRGRSPSPSPAQPSGLTDKTFSQIMRDGPGVHDLDAYLQRLGVDRCTLVARLMKILEDIPKTGRHGRKRHRYRTLLKRLKANSTEQ